MHAIRSFRLSGAASERNLAGLINPEAIMNNLNDRIHFQALDDLLFAVALFAPVSLLLSGSLALAAMA
jgi:hypothetical protein